MKIRTNIILTSLIIFFISSTSLAQTDTTEADSVEFQFDPRIACVQIEGCFMFLGVEYGGLVDVDLFSHNNDKFVGLRLAYEKYEHYSFNKGSIAPCSDFCLYARPSLKLNRFLFSVYGGLAYHLGEGYNNDKKVFFRTGLELKYIPFGNLIGIIFKGSTSFIIETSFIGLGVSVGYFN